MISKDGRISAIKFAVAVRNSRVQFPCERKLARLSVGKFLNPRSLDYNIYRRNESNLVGRLSIYLEIKAVRSGSESPLSIRDSDDKVDAFAFRDDVRTTVRPYVLSLAIVTRN